MNIHRFLLAITLLFSLSTPPIQAIDPIVTPIVVIGAAIVGACGGYVGNSYVSKQNKETLQKLADAAQKKEEQNALRILRELQLKYSLELRSMKSLDAQSVKSIIAGKVANPKTRHFEYDQAVEKDLQKVNALQATLAQNQLEEWGQLQTALHITQRVVRSTLGSTITEEQKSFRAFKKAEEEASIDLERKKLENAALSSQLNSLVKKEALIETERTTLAQMQTMLSQQTMDAGANARSLHHLSHRVAQLSEEGERNRQEQAKAYAELRASLALLQATVEKTHGKVSTLGEKIDTSINNARSMYGQLLGHIKNIVHPHHTAPQPSTPMEAVPAQHVPAPTYGPQKSS